MPPTPTPRIPGPDPERIGRFTNTVAEANRDSAEMDAAAERTEEYVKARLARADQEGKQLLAKTQIRGGAQKLSPSSLKGSALLGRNDNVKAKAAFKRGAVARTDPNGGSTKAAQKKNGRKRS